MEIIQRFQSSWFDYRRILTFWSNRSPFCFGNLYWEDSSRSKILIRFVLVLLTTKGHRLNGLSLHQ